MQIPILWNSGGAARAVAPPVCSAGKTPERSLASATSPGFRLSRPRAGREPGLAVHARRLSAVSWHRPRPLQANGFAPDGSVRSLSLGVVVTSQVPDGRAASNAISAEVAFAPRSARLSPLARTILRRLATRAQDAADVVRVRGYVQRSSDTTNDMSLSRARAHAVAQYLRSLGLRADYRVTGAGAASPTAKGRRADIVISRSWA